MKIPADSKVRDFGFDLADQSHLSVSSLQPRVTMREEGRWLPSHPIKTWRFQRILKSGTLVSTWPTRVTSLNYSPRLLPLWIISRFPFTSHIIPPSWFWTQHNKKMAQGQRAAGKQRKTCCSQQLTAMHCTEPTELAEIRLTVGGCQTAGRGWQNSRVHTAKHHQRWERETKRGDGGCLRGAGSILPG